MTLAESRATAEADASRGCIAHHAQALATTVEALDHTLMHLKALRAAVIHGMTPGEIVNQLNTLTEYLE